MSFLVQVQRVGLARLLAQSCTSTPRRAPFVSLSIKGGRLREPAWAILIRRCKMLIAVAIAVFLILSLLWGGRVLAYALSAERVLDERLARYTRQR